MFPKCEENQLHRKLPFLTNFIDDYQQKYVIAALNLIFQLNVQMGKSNYSKSDYTEIVENLFSIAARSCMEDRTDSQTYTAAVGTQNIIYQFTSNELFAIKQQLLKSSVYQLDEMFSNEVCYKGAKMRKNVGELASSETT